MSYAWMIVISAALAASAAWADSDHHAASSPAGLGEATETLVPKSSPGSVVAVDAASGDSVRANTLIHTRQAVRTLIDKRNMRVELGPGTVAEFLESGALQVYRGSACLTSTENRGASTANALVEFTGRILLSFDAEEKSTSVFLVDGSGQVRNPHHPEKALPLGGSQGATLLTGDVYPNLIRSLDRVRADTWLEGYGWNAKQREAFFTALPKSNRAPAGKIEASAEKNQDATVEKLAEYFPAIDETQPQPRYYEEKFSGESVSQKRTRRDEQLRNPELAASIPLPTTKINLDMDFEVVPFKKLDHRARKPASQPKAKAVQQKAVAQTSAEDADVTAALQRLQQLHQDKGQDNGRKPAISRRPAGVPAGESPIPDPVYDFSENF